MAKYISISGSEKTMIVDDDDYPFISTFKWRLHKPGKKTKKNFYAITTMPFQSRKNNIHVHSLAHILIMRDVKGLQVDHINGDGLDNRKSNLRLVSQSENMLNRKGPQKNGTHGFVGVMKSIKTYATYYNARITVLRKIINIGNFKSPILAAIARDKYVLDNGINATVNFPNGFPATQLTLF